MVSYIAQTRQSVATAGNINLSWSSKLSSLAET